jgi:hypothetical protein
VQEGSHTLTGGSHDGQELVAYVKWFDRRKTQPPNVCLSQDELNELREPKMAFAAYPIITAQINARKHDLPRAMCDSLLD